MYYNHLFDITTWDAQALYIVWDDFGWEYIPAKKGFIGAQKEFTLTDKYRKKKTVTWGKPSIVLTNDEPTLTNWERVNTEVVRINERLF